jgi:hypothetical protein
LNKKIQTVRIHQFPLQTEALSFTDACFYVSLGIHLTQKILSFCVFRGKEI